MPAGKPTIASNTQTGGHAQPQSRPEIRRTAPQCFIRYPNAAPLVFEQLPEHGSPAISASEIHRRIDGCTCHTVRHILWSMVKDGIATSEIVPMHGKILKRIYSKAPSADNFEDSAQVYGAAAE